MMRFAGVALFAMLMAVAPPVAAQDSQTLADIRQEMSILYVEVQKLKRELSTTGSPSVNTSGSSVLDRVAAMEAELQRLTALTEALGNRINQIVEDGTNRIGDLEFRLVELEGGDVSTLGQTSTLGGAQPVGTQVIAAPTAPVTNGTELAVGEAADFQTATRALEDGNNSRAAELFAAFNAAYPGSPLAAQAELNRGSALQGLGDTREAARAYLAAFSASPTGPQAPDALFRLGAALGALGQKDQACITLGEVGIRFPGTTATESAQQEMARLGCS